MQTFTGFGDKYDLTKLKQYVKDHKILEEFTPEQQKDLEVMAKELERLIMEGDNE